MTLGARVSDKSASIQATDPSVLFPYLHGQAQHKIQTVRQRLRKRLLAKLNLFLFAHGMDRERTWPDNIHLHGVNGVRVASGWPASVPNIGSMSKKHTIAMMEAIESIRFELC